MRNRSKKTHGHVPVAVESPEQFLDAMMNEYVTWREACAALAASYEHWNRADAELQDAAFRAYTAALDREEQSARRYQRAVERVATALAP